jgi:hypothetical protein
MPAHPDDDQYVDLVIDNPGVTGAVSTTTSWEVVSWEPPTTVDQFLAELEDEAKTLTDHANSLMAQAEVKREVARRVRDSINSEPVPGQEANSRIWSTPAP